MGEIVDLFINKKPLKNIVSDVVVDPLTYWKLRNDLISDEFQLYNAHEKQGILDTVLQMNLELYTLVIKLKEKLGE